jgi:hypothetical protein
VAAALGGEGAGELRARDANMDRDQALACTLTQTTQALSELKSRPSHERVVRPGADAADGSVRSRAQVTMAVTDWD